jgi:Na+/melibiose symporter-like transporter
MARATFSWPNFLIRWAAALILVFATFNPTSYSYFAWVTEPDSGQIPLKALAGVVIAISYVVFLRATWRSIGPIGLVLAVSFFGSLVWVLIDFGLIVPGQGQQMTYVVLVIMASVLAVGMSWSHVRRRVAGQVDADDVDDQ